MTMLSEPRFEPIFRSDGKKIALTGPLPALAAKVRSSHVWVAGNLDDALKQQLMAAGSRPMPGIPAGANGAAAMTEALNGGTAFAAWATVQGGKVDFHAGLECTDAATAQAKVTKAEADAAKQKAGLSAMMLFIPASAKALVDEIKNSLKFVANGNMAEVSMQISVSNLEALAGQMGPGMPGNGARPGAPPNPRGNPAERPGRPGRGRPGPGGGR
jgi:hypothetical protein